MFSSIRTSVRSYVLRGILVVVPIGVTVYLLTVSYRLTAGHLVPILRPYTNQLPGYVVITLSITLFLAILYVIGLIAGLVLGRRLLTLGERILRRIPVVRTIYGASRQAVDALSILGEDTTHQAAAIVPFPSPSAKAIGFVTGKLDIEGEGSFYRVFIPTTPNPTSGFLEIYPSDQVTFTNMSTENALMSVMSAGILIPGGLRMEGYGEIDPHSGFLADAVAGLPKPSGAAENSALARAARSIRKRLLSGLAVLLPIGITILVLDLMYTMTAGQITPLTQWIVGPLPGYVKAVVSTTLLIILLYGAGYAATAYLGTRLIRTAEMLIERVPLVTTVYRASKQIVATLVDPASGPKFQAPVLVRFPHEGARTIGFLVGKVTSKNGREYYKVFVPTTPNVTVGLLEFFNRGDISGCSLSLEEAIKMVVSGGIVGPSAISTVPLSDEIHSDTASPIRSI